jgi:hypothetical protein
MGDSQQVNNLLQQLARQTASLAQVQAEWERRQSATPRSLRVRLGDANYEVRLEALEELAEALGNEDLSLGDTTIIARRLREEGSLARLALLVQDDSNEVLTRALYCLGNLCSDSFDTASRETKKLLFERDGSGARARRGVTTSREAYPRPPPHLPHTRLSTRELSPTFRLPPRPPRP